MFYLNVVVIYIYKGERRKFNKKESIIISISITTLFAETGYKRKRVGIVKMSPTRQTKPKCTEDWFFYVQSFCSDQKCFKGFESLSQTQIF